MKEDSSTKHCMLVDRFRTVKVSNVSVSLSERDIFEFLTFSGEILYIEMQRLVFHHLLMCYHCIKRHNQLHVLYFEIVGIGDEHYSSLIQRNRNNSGCICHLQRFSGGRFSCNFDSMHPYLFMDAIFFLI